MSELRQARFFAASCVAFYVIMVWYFWKEPWVPPPPAPEVPAALVASDDAHYRDAFRAAMTLTEFVRWAFEPPARVVRQVAGAGRAWLGLTPVAVPDC